MLDFEVVCDGRSGYSNGPHAHVDDMLFLPVDGLFSIRSSGKGNAAFWRKAWCFSRMRRVSDPR